MWIFAWYFTATLVTFIGFLLAALQLPADFFLSGPAAKSWGTILFLLGTAMQLLLYTLLYMRHEEDQQKVAKNQ